MRERRRGTSVRRRTHVRTGTRKATVDWDPYANIVTRARNDCSVLGVVKESINIRAGVCDATLFDSKRLHG